MRNKKGFTLIELLSVIAILAIILVIAVPQVLGMLKGAKEKSLESSAKLVIKAVEQKIAEQEIEGEEYTLNGNCEEVSTWDAINGTCTYNINPITKKVLVTINGIGKFEGLIAKGSKEFLIVGTEDEINVEINVTPSTEEFVIGEELVLDVTIKNVVNPKYKITSTNIQPNSNEINETASSSIIISSLNVGNSYLWIKATDIFEEEIIISFGPYNGLVFICGRNLYDTRDGKTYKTVKIGEQCWFAEDLMYNCGRTTWDGNGCRLNGNSDGTIAHSNSPTMHYQWGAAMAGSTTAGARGVCPEGWFLPSDADWTRLTNFAGILKDPYLIGTAGNGLNLSLNGNRSTGGSLSSSINFGYWWTSSSAINSNSWPRHITDGPNVYRQAFPRINGFAVRCLLVE